MKNVLAGAAAMMVFVTLPVSGHHSESAFDVESVVAFQGIVTQFSWRNPHTYLTVQTADENGEQSEWEIETGATPLLIRSGWTPDALIPGDRVSVRGHPVRDSGRHYALLLSLEKGDGSVLEQTLADSQPTGSASDLSGVWKGSASGLGAFLERWVVRPLTEEGRAAQAQFDINSEHPAARCIGNPSPTIVFITALYLSEIELNEDVVVIRNEMFDVERSVFMDGRGHPGNDDERTLQGHSVGRWEGNTLVVDTTHFADHRSPDRGGIPSGAQKHVVERYTLSDDGARLMIDIFLEDPEYLAEPFTGALEWNYRPDLELLRYDCDTGVASQYIPR